MSKTDPRVAVGPKTPKPPQTAVESVGPKTPKPPQEATANVGPKTPQPPPINPKPPVDPK